MNKTASQRLNDVLNDKPVAARAETQGASRKPEDAGTTAAAASAPQAGTTAVAASAEDQNKNTGAITSDEEVNVIDPNKKIALPSGERITFEEYNRRALRHDQYAQKTSKLDLEYKTKFAELDKMNDDYKDARYVRDLALGDPIAAVYLQLRSQGIPVEEAQARAWGSSGKPAPNKPYDLSIGASQIPPPPNDDPDSKEYREWEHTTYLPAIAKKSVEETYAPRIKQLEDQLRDVKSQTVNEAKDITDRATRLAKNNETLQSVWNELETISGIKAQELKPEEFHDLRGKIGQIFLDMGINVNDSSYLERNDVSERDIQYAAMKAVAEVRNPFTQAAPALQKPRTSNNALSGTPSGGSAPSSGAVGASRPRSFGQSRMMNNLDRVLKT